MVEAQAKNLQSMERHRVYIEELIPEKKELLSECSRLEVEKVEAEANTI